METNIPEIEVEYDDGFNPYVFSPNAPYGITFYQTRESMADVEVYKSFLTNSISRFRHSVTYKGYKGYLMSLGLDHCQVMPNVTEENVGAQGIEMHHNFLTIFDIALLITEHVLNTRGYICTFELVHLLKQEHRANRIPIVMVSETVHEMYHNNEELIFPAQMCFGYWVDLLRIYNRGITVRIAQKIINYINRSIYDSEANQTIISNMMALRDEVEGWSRYNEYADNRRVGIITVGGGYYDQYPDNQYLLASSY